MAALVWLGDALLLAGGFFLVVGAVGLLRFPDVFTRMHATSVSETLGTYLLLLGLCLQGGGWQVIAKLLLILLFMFITAPTATHALAKAALSDGVKPQAERWDRQ